MPCVRELLHFSSVTVHAEKSGWVVNTFNYGEWTITIPVFLEQKPVPSGRQCFSFLWIIPELFLQTAISSANLILSHENGNQPCCFLIHFCWELEQNGNISSLRSWQAQQQGSLLGMKCSQSQGPGLLTPASSIRISCTSLFHSTPSQEFLHSVPRPKRKASK